MRTFLLLNNLILIFALLQSNGNSARVSARPASELSAAKFAPESRSLAVRLKSATDARITFRTEHNEKMNIPEPEGKRIPHLVLNRNGVPTPGFERTLIVSLENIVVPVSGTYAQLTIETQHGDPDLGGGKANRIQVWEETKFVPYYGESDQLTTIDFQVAFQRTFKHLGQELQTPTDYFNYQIKLFDRQGKILKKFREDYAFLMENQWRVPLPKVLEAAPGAAPSELVIYFYDMIPFQIDLRDPDTQVPRGDVERYIQTELAPAMVNAFILQTDLWELPWYEEWSNNRVDEDPKSLSVALVEYGTWFHGRAPSLGHAMISIRVDGSFSRYSNLTDGIMSVFHHELFHNQQRNLSLHFGSRGNLAGKEEVWKLFSEGTAVLASSVGQPALQFEHAAGLRSYFKRANAFIGAEGQYSGSLNKNYKEVPYQTSLYWRFLYENCGGMSNGVEDPATGMKVIGTILETLYTGEIADINSSTDVSDALPRVVDSTLRMKASCPFHTYEESLVQFARAIYKLRLEDGRCLVLDNTSSCGFYDPHKLYTTPHAERYLASTGSTLISGSIPSSYGIDLVELALDPSVEGKSLRILFRGTSTPGNQFHVELLGINIQESETGVERSTAQTGMSRSARTENGQLILDINGLNLEAFNGLGLIVTRLDPYEKTGLSGNYVIQLIVE